MVMGENISCSELKKLQLKRRRNKSKNDEQGKSLVNLNINQLSSGFTGINDFDNLLVANPFAIQQTINENTDSNENLVIIMEMKSTNLETNFGFEKMEIKANESLEFQNSIQKDHKPELLITEKSLKTSIIFESDTNFSILKNKLSDPVFLLKNMRDPQSENVSFYYRYPDVTLPLNQRKNIHKALSNNFRKTLDNDENLIWYRMFSEKWRKALLSVFESFKHGFTDCFYFVQENLTILFERDLRDLSLRAYMQLSNIALEEDLKKMEIEYKTISRNSNKSFTSAVDKKQISRSEDNGDKDEEEIFDNEIQIKKTKKLFTKEDISIEGGLALAELVDFLINQKDRNSYAILPEIFSPSPFVYGTLRNNITSFSGPCKGVDGEEFYHFKLNGIIFPNSINSIIQDLHSHGHKLSMTVERESNTDFLSAYLHQIYMK